MEEMVQAKERTGYDTITEDQISNTPGEIANDTSEYLKRQDTHILPSSVYDSSG